MADLKKLQKSQKALQEKIDKMIEDLDKSISKASSSLVNSIIDEFVSKLQTVDGVIINNAQNIRLISIIDKLYATFNKKENLRIVLNMVDNIATINALNSGHFSKIYAKPINSISSIIEKTVNNRFGINADGTLIRDGYMMGLLDDVTVRNDIKQTAFRAVQNATGWNDFANQLKVKVEGDPEKMGTFKRFYRNYAYDVYSQADRLNSAQYSTRLGLNYAIYEGGLIETSREFCRERNGKVFSRDEILSFKLTEAAPPDYDPITDLGGYGCRHYLNWISDELAFMLRPDLKEKAERQQQPGQPNPTPPPLKK